MCVHASVSVSQCECVHVGALCARVMALCPGLSAALPPSPGALSPSSRRSPPAGNPLPSSFPGELPQPLEASGTVSRPMIPGPPSPARPHSGAPDPNSQSTLGSSPVPSKLTIPLTRPAPLVLSSTWNSRLELGSCLLPHPMSSRTSWAPQVCTSRPPFRPICLSASSLPTSSISGLGCSSSLLVGPHIHSLLPPSQFLGVSHQGCIAVDGGPGTGQPPLACCHPQPHTQGLSTLRALTDLQNEQ